MQSTEQKFAVVAFIPAIHSGYISFFRKYPGTLYALGKDFIVDFPHMERDLRTPDFEDLKKIIDSLGIFDEVIELNRNSITEIPKELHIVMPSDEITEKIAEMYFDDRNVQFDSMFLRWKWDREVSLKDFEVAADRTVSESERDKELIGHAFELAKKSSDWWRQIGVLIVKEGKILVSGFNSHMPTDFNLDSFGDPRSSFSPGVRFDLSSAIHGEATAIAQAAKEGISVKDASLYVTTFPCPVCAKLVAEAGIKKVYYSVGYSLLDAENVLKDFGVEIVVVK